jgi:leucyl/phenylalanyl-tRNA--protein transferase
MAIIEFPPIEQADEHGLLAIGGDLEISSLLLAYTEGIFPWPINEEYPIAWFSPDPRGVLFFEDLYISRSTHKILKKNQFEIRFNTSFEQVIRACAESKNRKDQPGTWITDEIIHAYMDLHRAGYAYCVEAFKDDHLVGGIYGVCIGDFFSGESMFYLEDNASKVALIHLCHFLKEKGILWLDTQMVTPVVKALGGKEIPREQFLGLLSELKSKNRLLNL